MYCEFLLLSIADCKEWLEKADIDWGRVTDDTNIDIVVDEDDKNYVVVTVYDLEKNDETVDTTHVCQVPLQCRCSADFGLTGFGLKEFKLHVENAYTQQMLFVKEFDTNQLVWYEFTQSAEGWQM